MNDSIPIVLTRDAALVIDRIAGMSHNHPKLQYFRLNRAEVKDLTELLRQVTRADLAELLRRKG